MTSQTLVPNDKKPLGRPRVSCRFVGRRDLGALDRQACAAPSCAAIACDRHAPDASNSSRAGGSGTSETGSDSDSVRTRRRADVTRDTEEVIAAARFR